MRSEELRKKMFTLVQEWELSEQTRETFCAAQGINLAKFGYWRSLYLKSQESSEGEFRAICPIVEKAVDIRYPNGVTLSVPRGTPVEEIKSLICLF